LGGEQIVNVVDILLHYFVDIGQMRHHLSGHVDDEAGAPRIWEALNALVGDYLDKFDMPVLFGDGWQVLVDEVAELVGRLVEVQNDEGGRIGLGHLSNVLVSGYLHDLSVFLQNSLNLHLLHALGHILLGELILEV
jgi:hypothetical protein